MLDQRQDIGDYVLMTRPSFSYLVASLVAFTFIMTPPADARRRRRTRARVGYVSIESLTDKARVYIDGKYIGKTPFEKKLKFRPGKHKLKATKPGFMSSEMPFTIRRGRTTNLTIDLLPSSGFVKFDCNIEGAEVYLDGKLLGNTPLIKDIPLGEHVVTITKETYNDFTTQLVVTTGKKAFINGKLTPYNDLTPEALAIKREKQEKERQAAEAKTRLEESVHVQPVDEAHWYDDWYEKWWFWTAVGVVVVTSVAVPVATSSGGPQAGLNDHEGKYTISLP